MNTSNSSNTAFTLPEFEGTLELLYSLIQKQELDLLSIPMKELTLQLGQKVVSIDSCSDTMAMTATLLLLKSRKLLPDPSDPELEEEEGERLALIEHLLAYCRLKEAASELSKKEEQQLLHFLHLPTLPAPQRKAGLEGLSLEHLAQRFQAVLQKAAAASHQIQEEVWQVEQQIGVLEDLLRKEERDFESVFSEEKSRLELIVTFLALLELMKGGKVIVMQKDHQWVMKLTS